MFELLIKFMPETYAVFVFNMFKAGFMVSVDAAIFMVAVLLLIEPKLRWLVVILITVAHTFYGFLGLGAEMLLFDAGIIVVIIITSYIGLRFIIEGLNEADDGDPEDDARKINKLGIFSLSAIALYSAVSIDELFAVLQRYQWMEAQGWSDGIKAANIATSMVVLFGILSAVKIALEKGVSLSWIERHGDEAMFVVFSLIMYYIVRGIVQNAMGYEPIDIWLLTEYTGLAPELVIVGFVLTWILKKSLENEAISIILNKLFLLKTKPD